MDEIMSRMKRLQEYADPSHSKWRGQSTRENIDRWSERAHQKSDGAWHRAKGGSTELPTTGPVRLHETHVRAGDPRAEAKADKNHVDKLTEYMRGIRRDS
jgi:hypothetical protein